MQPAMTVTPIEWAVTLTQTSYPTAIRASLEHDMIEVATRERTLFTRWAAGVLEDLAATLPRVDPWRAVSGRIQNPDLPELTCGENPPARTTGWGQGREFGTWRDGTDLFQPLHPNLLLDPFLAPLAKPLTRHQSALFAFVVAGRGVEAIEALDPVDVFTLIEPVARWLVWRRLCFMQGPDVWVVECALHHRDVVVGEQVDPEWGDRLTMERVDDGEYDAMALGGL